MKGARSNHLKRYGTPSETGSSAAGLCSDHIPLSDRSAIISIGAIPASSCLANGSCARPDVAAELRQEAVNILELASHLSGGQTPLSISSICVQAMLKQF